MDNIRGSTQICVQTSSSKKNYYLKNWHQEGVGPSQCWNSLRLPALWFLKILRF
jgi:hypothetical protein